MERYEVIPHTADIGIKAYGDNLKDLFINAAYGMFDIIADLGGLKNSVSIDINIDAPNEEELLVSWLDELLYNFYTKQLIFSEFEIKDIGPTRLAGMAHGRHIGENRNRLKTEVKAVTYHELKIEREEGKLTAHVIFDV